MSKSPAVDLSQFVPKEVLSPNKDQPGLSKTVFTHINNLHGLLDDWSRMRDKGTRLLRGVLSIKLHECNDDYYPSQLKPLMEGLVEILDSLKNIVNGVRVICNQMQALSKLAPTDVTMISTWSTSQINEACEKLYNSVYKEYNLKTVITENIAHCRDEKLIEVYSSSWELEPYLTSESGAYLFAEMGLSGLA